MRFTSFGGGLRVEAGGLPPVWFHGSVLLLAVLVTAPLWWGLYPSRLPAVPIVMVGVVLSLLAHEMAHALVARRCGLTVTLIRLHALGGDASFTGPGWSRMQDRLITVAGPLANLAIALACLAAARALMPDPWADFVPGQPWHTPPPTPTPPLARALQWLGWLNLAWGGVNLLPAFPLDGGHLLHSLLAPRVGERRALRWVGCLGCGLAVASGLASALGLLAGVVIWCPPSLAPNRDAVRRGRAPPP